MKYIASSLMSTMTISDLGRKCQYFIIDHIHAPTDKKSLLKSSRRHAWHFEPLKNVISFYIIQKFHLLTNNEIFLKTQKLGW
jgi:hypothetical protein